MLKGVLQLLKTNDKQPIGSEYKDQQDDLGNTLAHYWIMIKRTEPPESIVNIKVNKNGETLSHLWLKLMRKPLPFSFCNSPNVQDIQGNTIGHLIVMYLHMVPPKRYLTNVRNNDGYTLAHLYYFYVSKNIPEVLVHFDQKHFECPICYVSKFQQTKSCEHCGQTICKRCWLQCRNCPFCRQE